MSGIVRELHPGHTGVQENIELDGKGAIPTYNLESNNAEGASAKSSADDDAKSDHFQDGVQRVRAITDTWDRKTMIIMFVL